MFVKPNLPACLDTRRPCNQDPGAEMMGAFYCLVLSVFPVIYKYVEFLLSGKVIEVMLF